MLCDWDLQTYNEWHKLLEKESKDVKIPRSGLQVKCHLPAPLLYDFR